MPGAQNLRGGRFLLEILELYIFYFYLLVALSPYPEMPYLNFHLNNINMPAAWAVPLRSLPQVDFSCNKLTSSGLEAIASCEAISAGFKYRIFLFVISGTWLGLMNADVWWSFRRNMLCSDGAAPHISSDHLVVPKCLVHKVKFCIHCPDLCVFKAGTAAQNGDMRTHTDTQSLWSWHRHTSPISFLDSW